MAAAVFAYNCTVPAGTALAAPVVIALPVGPDPVTAIRWRVPPGPRGHLAFWLAQSGVAVIPDNRGSPIVADDEWDTIDCTGFPETGAWQFYGANDGIDDHTVHLQIFTGSGEAGGGPVDILAGFPVTEMDLATMWPGGGSGAVLV